MHIEAKTTVRVRCTACNDSLLAEDVDQAGPEKDAVMFAINEGWKFVGSMLDLGEADIYCPRCVSKLGLDDDDGCGDKEEERDVVDCGGL